MVENSPHPLVRISYEWTQYAVWLIERDGSTDNVAGHEIGLSPELVASLLDWTERGDDAFDEDYPPDTKMPDGFYEDGLGLAKEVRRELGPEWVVQALDPVNYAFVTLPPTPREG